MPISWPHMDRKKVICFVDDDPKERARFEEAMASKEQIICVTESGYPECMAKLTAKGLKHPHLWVLDLYFPEQGVTNTQEERDEMARRYGELEQKVREFRAYLKSIGQGAQGGLDLLKRCRENHRAPVVMFTRKGNLEDALTCLDSGAVAVLKKPMPANLSGSSNDQTVQLNQAMAQQAGYLAGKFMDAIRTNTFWYRHRGKVGLVAGGVFTALMRFIGGLF
jgi:CheY-like chemotaxis protein